MAEFPKSPIQQVNLSERNSFSVGIESTTPIVLIDKQAHQHHPTLYQLRKEAIDQILHSDHFTHLPKNAFLPVGDVTAIDKQNRIIHLTNGDSVNYQYMVIIKENNAKNKSSDEIYNEALQTLLEAIAIRSSLPNSLYWEHSPSTPQTASQFSNCSELTLLKQLQLIATKRLHDKKTPPTSFTQSADRLFEIII